MNTGPERLVSTTVCFDWATVRRRIVSASILRLVALACWCWLSGTACLAVDERVSLRKQAEELIRGLDAATLADRTRAERGLVELGSDVLPLLPTPELIESQSARDAVRRIRPLLERAAARESSAPAFVTLKGQTGVAETIEQIQRQSKNLVVLEDETNTLKDLVLEVDWKDELFWNCINDVCRQAKLSWRFAKDRAAIELIRASTAIRQPLAIQCTGPFRIAINQIELRPVVGQEDYRLVRVTGQVAIEPRLRPLFLSVQAGNLKAVDDRDERLEPWNPDAKYEFPFGDGGRQVELRWDFRQPRSSAPTTLTIQGALNCQIAAATERVVFDQTSLTRGTIRRRGGVSIRIRRVQAEPLDDDRLNEEIGIVVSYDNGGPAFESHRSWIFHNAAYLEMKTGQRTSFTDFEISQQTDGAIAVDYRWQNILRPAIQPLFVYEAPTLIISLPVEIDLRAVPIADDTSTKK